MEKWGRTSCSRPLLCQELTSAQESECLSSEPRTCLLQLLPELPALATDSTDFRLLLCPQRIRALSQGLDLCLQAEGRVVNREGRLNEPRCLPELCYSLHPSVLFLHSLLHFLVILDFRFSFISLWRLVIQFILCQETEHHAQLRSSGLTQTHKKGMGKRDLRSMILGR